MYGTHSVLGQTEIFSIFKKIALYILIRYVVQTSACIVESTIWLHDMIRLSDADGFFYFRWLKAY